MKLIRTSLLLSLACTFIFISCKDSTTSVDVVDEDEIVINPNTKAIDETNWIDSIQKIDSTNFTITFDASFVEAEAWQEGDLLVSAIGEGLLRTVTGVSTTNGIITVKTEQATLVDYIQQGRISERISLGIDDVQKVTYLKEGVLLLQEPDELKAHKLYAEKANGLPWKIDTKFTGNGSIDVFGDYLLEADLIFELDVRLLGRLQYFEMSYELKNTLAIGMKAEQNLEVSSSADIAKVRFNPITIVVPALPVPIVIIPTLVVNIGVDGEVTGQIYTDVNYVNTLQVGTAFQHGEGWKEILEREDTFGYNPPTLGLNAKIETYLSTKYNMAVYGVLSGYLRAAIYSLAEAGLNRDPWWELFLGLRGGIGASATIISIELFDFNKNNLIDFRRSIAKAAEDKVPISTIETIDEITVSSARVVGKVERESGSTPITDRGVCWSVNNNPTTSDDCNQEESGDGSFTTTITELSSGTQYYVRTYAINNAGTAYSNEQAFTTVGQSLATVITSEITSVTYISAQSGGNVTDDGNATVITRGVCWSTSQNPTTSNSCTSDGYGIGSFNSNLTNLSAETQYYVRAYATNSEGTAYGDQQNFTTDSDWPRDTYTAVVEITSATGRIWMDRNLGASRAATSTDDEQAYGDLYQWGRAADGHQRRSSATTSVLSSSNQPGHGNFILTPNNPWDWRSPANDNLWQGVNGINNPCPEGFRLPTEAEWVSERQSWISNDTTGAFTSPLKLIGNSLRTETSGDHCSHCVHKSGYYWSDKTVNLLARLLNFTFNDAFINNRGRANGLSVRCIKD